MPELSPGAEAFLLRWSAIGEERARMRRDLGAMLRGELEPPRIDVSAPCSAEMLRDLAQEVRAGALCWEPEARLVGNVRAADVVRVCDAAADRGVWTPCRERLPAVGEVVLVGNECWDRPLVAWLAETNGVPAWTDGERWWRLADGTHWLPLPAGPEPEEAP